MNMSQQKYIKLTKGVQDFGILIKPEEINKYIKDTNSDYYTSTYYYDENHFKEFKKVKSTKGFTGQKTDKIWFDFDCKENIDLARKDSLELIEKFKALKIDPNSLDIYFSGNKGFNVILNLTKEINRKQVENVAKKFANNLKTFDPSLYDENQILRVTGTKHPESGYYKTQLSYEELQTKDIQELFELAKKVNEPFDPAPKLELDDSLFEIEEVKEEHKTQALEEFDLSTKPRNWKASKWALLQGFIKPGERDTSSMILASTCRALGYDKLTSYYMVKSALKKSWERYGEGGTTKEDIWNKIERIFSSEWKGGQYSEKEDLFLQKKAEEVGVKELTQSTTVDIKGALTMFKGYAKHIDELTLKTGIVELDKKQRITVGMSWGIIAGPGSGKTSVALQILHSMSKSGQLCAFFSYDMFGPHVIQKIIQTHWNGDNVEEVFNRYKNGDNEYVRKIEDLITAEYPNVEFCFESGQSIDDVRQTIHDAEQKRGMKMKFIVIDYNELVITDVNDPTQSSNKVAQQIRALASNEQVNILSLFQPNKLTGDPSVEIKSYRSAKGGSGIEQSVSLMFGMSRPGFDPRQPEQDKFVSLNCVKNRMGSIFAIDLFWDGYRGIVKSLNPTQRAELAQLRKSLEEEKGDASEPW